MIKCVVLAPRDLLLPVIGQHINGKLIFANCKTCAELKQVEVCHHTEKEREFLVTVCSVELEEALRTGYKIQRFIEVWNWCDDRWEQGGLFRKTTDKFYAIKLAASGYPAHIQTAEQRERYLDEVMEKRGIDMRQFCTETGLRIENIKPLKTIGKLGLNSIWGKLVSFGEKTVL